MSNAIITVSNKSGIDTLSNFLLEKGFTIYSTGGTFTYIENNTPEYLKHKIVKISDLTGFPEILGGRVKTLHPKIYGGILCDNTLDTHRQDMEDNELPLFSLVVVNLYPFKEQNSIENIDIGGVSLIRAAAKNHEHISLLSKPEQYDYYINNYDQLSLQDRRMWALDGFQLTSDYDSAISTFFQSTDIASIQNNIKLKYGFNPHQSPCMLEYNTILDNATTNPIENIPENIANNIANNIPDNIVDNIANNIANNIVDNNSSANHLHPFKIINGTLGYINVLDCLHGWLTVYEIFSVTKQSCFISMKHTSPAGLGIGKSIMQQTIDIFGGINRPMEELTECEKAYINCRDCDPLSSFGDFVCYSGHVDVETARLIKREVCDGIAASSFAEEALEILKTKKGGKFIIIEMNTNYYNIMRKNGWTESKELYGIKISQPNNNFCMKLGSSLDRSSLDSSSLDRSSLDSSSLDAVIAYTILKYSQSNNISMVSNGQLLGLGCGQQNRVSCVALAGSKADKWFLRHHPETIQYYKSLPKELKRQEKVNKVYEFIDEHLDLLTDEFRASFNAITLGSDGFFPFTDNIYAAKKYGVKHIIQPGGSVQDSEVEKTCHELDITLQNINVRMFYH